jgi:hypothetical protein
MAQADRARRDTRAEEERANQSARAERPDQGQAQAGATGASPDVQSGNPTEGGAASGGGSAQQQLEESHDARAKMDESASPQSGRVPLPGTDAEPGGQVGTTERPLAGIQPFGVASAGGAEAHAALVGGDPHAYASMPGQSGVEAVGSGTPMLPEAAGAVEARVAAGVPEPPKVGPIPNTSLFDTHGGYQIVPAGTTPEQIPQNQASVRPAQGNFPQRPFGEEAGAENVAVAGPGAE